MERCSFFAVGCYLLLFVNCCSLLCAICWLLFVVACWLLFVLWRVLFVVCCVLRVVRWLCVVCCRMCACDLQCACMGHRLFVECCLLSLCVARCWSLVVLVYRCSFND